MCVSRRKAVEKDARTHTHTGAEISTLKIGIQLHKLWITEVQFLVPVLKTIGITKKSNMKMG